jgi:hypothetical protein
VQSTKREKNGGENGGHFSEFPFSYNYRFSMRGLCEKFVSGGRREVILHSS